MSRSLIASASKRSRVKSVDAVDIGVPRNISSDAADVSGTLSYDVDDLQEVVERNVAARQQLAQQAEVLLDQDRQAFLDWWDGLEAVPTINRMRQQFEEIRKQELLKALSRMGSDFSQREKQVVEALTKGLINKILHGPTTALRAPQPRQQRLDSMAAAQRLFDLPGDDSERDRSDAN